MTSFLFPLPSQTVTPPVRLMKPSPHQVVTLILQSCTKKWFSSHFLGLGLAFYQLAMTASAGRVIFNRDRTDWALFSGNCRNISGKCRRPKNLITLHHETDHGKHWTPPRLICCCRSVRDWIFPLTFTELSTTPDLRLQGHQFQKAHIKTLEFKWVSSGHLINALSFCWKSVGTRLS